MKIIIAFVIGFLSLSFSSGLQAACCSGHGGPVPCTKSSGPQMCQDGTKSPSCVCTKELKLEAQAEKKALKLKETEAKKAEREAKKAEKAEKAEKVIKKKVKKVKAEKEKVEKAIPEEVKEEKAPKATRKAKAVVPSSEGARGCCSHHGGLAGKCSSNQKQICADGTESDSCACN